MDLGAKKGCFRFPKASALLEPHYQIVYCHIQDTLIVCVCGARGSYPSAEVQSVYSTAPADWAKNSFGYFYGIMTQFELVKHKLLNSTLLHVHLYGFQITQRVKQWMFQCTNYQNTTKPQLERLQSCHKLACIKILQIFWLTLVLEFLFINIWCTLVKIF